MRSRRSTRRPPDVSIEVKGASSMWLEDDLSHAKELSDRVTELSTLMGVSTLLSSEHPLPKVLEAVCRLGAQICKAQVAFVHLTDGDDDPVCIGRHTLGDSLQYAWEGIARVYGRQAIQKDEMIACSNVLLRPGGEQEDLSNPRMGGICAVPLRGRGRIVGAMSMGYSGTHRSSAREKDMLSAVAAQVAMAVERSWLFEQIQDQLARANSLREVAGRIGSNLELDAVLDSTVREASRLLAGEFSAVFLVDRPFSPRVSTPGRGRERDLAHISPVPLDDGPMGNTVRRAVEMARPATSFGPIPHPSSKLADQTRPGDYAGVMAVPLVAGQEVLGALVTCYRERRRFDASDISLAEDFAAQAALAIRNARLYEDTLENRLLLEAAIDQISNHGISLLDEELNITFANPATYWLVGASPKRRSMPFEEWAAMARKMMADGSELDRLLERVRANPEETVETELVARGTSDSTRSLRLLSLPLRQVDGSVKGRVNLIEECG